jgi:hypothetical protein
MCHHRTCASLNANNAKGIACLLFKKYFFHDGSDQWVIGCGRERGGSYRGFHNLFAGKLESRDNGCFLEALRREVEEESGGALNLNLGPGRSFDRIFRSKGHFEFFMMRRTPVFVGYLSDDFRSGTITSAMKTALANPALSHAYKELDDFAWFEMNGQPLPRVGGVGTLSSFAMGALSRCPYRPM